jgi:hypothetical protein
MSPAAKKPVRKSARTATATGKAAKSSKSTGFTSEERAAMKARAQELKAEKNKAVGE